MGKYFDENSLSCLLEMTNYATPAYYNIVREVPVRNGFKDLVFIPEADAGNKIATIVELKCREVANTAIK